MSAMKVNDVRGLARAVVTGKTVKDQAEADYERQRTELLAVMLDLGALKLAVTDVDAGGDLGTVVLSSGKRTASVTDRVAFVAWIEERYPTEVRPVTTTVVREAFEAKLLATAKDAGKPVDPQTGELIPGLEVHEGNPYLTTTPTTLARAMAVRPSTVPDTADGSTLIGG